MTAPFDWDYELVSGEAFDQDRFNTLMTDLVSYVNAMQATVDTLATDADLDAHVASTAAHARYVIGQTGRTALAGTDWDGSTKLGLEMGTVTLSSGTATYTYSAAFPNGVLSAQATVRGTTPNAASVTGVGLSSLTVKGTGTDVVEVLVIGW